jgi:TolA-binding protein
MKKTNSLVLILAAAILAAPVHAADKRELAQVQRDIALLQDEMRVSLKAQNDRLIAMESMLKTMLDQLAATNRAVTVLDGSLKSRVEGSVVKPMADLGSRMDSMQEDYRYVRESVTELNSKLSKISTQVSQLNDAIRTMQAPPAPPSGDALMPASAAGPPQGVTAEGLFQDALRDKSGANSDLALRQFNDYLTWYGSTDLAPEAQYYIGEIYYNKKDFDSALRAFDMVLERYPRNAKTNDARFMKGRALVQLGQRNDGAEEFRALVKASPNSELGRRAQSELRSLGVSSVSPAKPRKK